MEANTILLNVRDYNGLRDFKKNVLAGKSIGISRRSMYNGVFKVEDTINYYSEDAIFSDIVEQNSMLEDYNEILEKRNSELMRKLEVEKSDAVEDMLLRASERETIYSSIKKMSFLQLLKFWIT